jgi:TonB-dependent starch-binding outer membrane protein SusC
MTASPQSRRRRTVLAVTLLAAALPLAGCHHAVEQRGGNSGDPNVLERHELDRFRVASMEELLQGRLPGVLVRRRGGNISVQIRGQNSVNSSNEALIIIDGVDASPRALISMSPQDVERVSVLKDGSAALYGVRGANGVLLITTRR